MECNVSVGEGIEQGSLLEGRGLGMGGGRGNGRG